MIATSPVAESLDFGRESAASSRRRFCVVGPSFMFASGISHHTHRLAHALATRHQVSVILLRRLLPRRFYPGAARVGRADVGPRWASDIRRYDGIDWYWIPSMFGALRELWDEKPDVVVLQWWTATVLHSYLLLAAVARLRGSRTVIEFHEVLDPGEAQIGWVRAYTRILSPLLFKLVNAFTVHSAHDAERLRRTYRLDGRPIGVAPHGPYDQYRTPEREPAALEPEEDVCRLLYFGVIRQYKGLDDLIEAFNRLPDELALRFSLTVVGETWEGWTRPAELIGASRHRERIEFVNRYVSDDELRAHLRRADAVVLPYRRSSASGPLHAAMSCGLPVVVTAVGGLPEAVAKYEGALLVPPGDVEALLEALIGVRRLRGRRFADPHSWEAVVVRHEQLAAVLCDRPLKQI